VHCYLPTTYRKAKTDLIINGIKVKTSGSSSQAGQLRSVKFNLAFQIKNVSNTIESQYKLEVSIPKDYLDGLHGMIRYKDREEGEFAIFSISNQSPIYQDEMVTVSTIDISVGVHTLYLLKLPITLKLYYSHGTRVEQFVLNELLTTDDKTPEEWNWFK
jgi:hypothetical protein